MTENSTDDTERDAPVVLVNEFRDKAENASGYGWEDGEIVAALLELACEINTETNQGGAAR